MKDTAEITLTVPADESCGRRKVVHTELIVHGQPTKSGDWPWHVALFTVQGNIVKYICGGTLLSKTLVLTGILYYILITKCVLIHRNISIFTPFIAEGVRRSGHYGV